MKRKVCNCGALVLFLMFIGFITFFIGWVVAFMLMVIHKHEYQCLVCRVVDNQPDMCPHCYKTEGIVKD